jgi:transcriptional regulator with GAF, ATPase, and Fis domain
MGLGRIERRRGRLVQFLIVLIMTFLALILVVAWNNDKAMLIKALVMLSLLSCLYAMAQERRLKQMHDDLLREVAGTREQVGELDRKLRSKKVEFVKLESRLKELTSLYRAISAVNAVADPRDTFDSVLLAAVDLVGGNCGSLMMVDAKRERLTFAAAIGLDQAVIARSGQKLGEGIAGWVAEHGEPVLLNGNIEDHPEFTNIVPREPELDVAISIPLRLCDETIGVLNLGSTVAAEKLAFSNDELRFAYIFAQHAAIAIERAQLLSDRQRLQQVISS